MTARINITCDTRRCPSACNTTRPDVADVRARIADGWGWSSEDGLDYCPACTQKRAMSRPAPTSEAEVDECGAVSPYGDVCARLAEHTGLCRSGEGRRHVSSPEKAGKPWFWYRSTVASLSRPQPGTEAP